MPLNRILLVLAGCAALVLSGCTSRHASAKAAKDQPPVLLDVRTPSEYAVGHISGAINLPLGQLKSQVSQVVPDKSTPVFVHCQSGGRSARAKVDLQNLGYTNVTDLGSYGNAKRVVEGP